MDIIDVVGTRQRGLVTRAQLTEAGVPGSTIDDWARSGRLVRLHPGVFRSAGAPETWEQRLLAATLAAGPEAAASHRSSALLWGLVDEAPIEISVPRSHGPRLQGVIVHRTRDALPIRRRMGIPATNPMRSLVDLGAVEPWWRVENALERGLVASLFSIAAVEWALFEVARPGRRGCGPLRRVLDDRALGAVPADGLLEPRMARLLRDTGLPPAVFQHPVGPFRIDFAYPDLMLAIEVDGWSAHATPRQLQADLDRQNGLVALGWTVLRFTWHDVIKRPAKVAAAIAAAIGHAKAGISA